MASQASQRIPKQQQPQTPSSLPYSETVPQEPKAETSDTHASQVEKESILHNEEWEDISSCRSRSMEQNTTQEIKREPTKTCWICQMDDTEDTEENTEWRRPCPCSLTAHDACLMEWISNEEAPKAGEIAHDHRIKCPQCKAEIQIERPRRILVTFIELIQSVAKLAIAPAAVGAVLSCTYWGLVVYGAHTLSIVFGPQEGARLLRGPLLQIINNGRDSLFSTNRLLSGIKIFLGVPLIAPALILLRTKLADQAFSLLLPLYFLSPSHRTISWPPSPALAFATVPYLRSAYNEIYRLKLAGLEKEWDLAVQRRPRPGETAEQIAAEANRADDDDDADEVLEININFGGFGPQEPELEQGVPLVQQGGVVNPAPPNPNDPAQPRANGDQRWEIQQNTSLSTLTSTVMGALFFPFISSLAGDILKHALPTRFIEPSVIITGGVFNRSKFVSRGLLTEKWGRTLVGGCLFVVLKDVVTLYCKWRKAKDFGKRKVKDWVGRRGGDPRPADQPGTPATT